MIQLLSYSGSLNLGDAIQTVALLRLLGDEVEYVDRNSCLFDPSRLAIVNGWLGRNCATRSHKVLFAGIHWANNYANLRWMRASRFPIGARDPRTQEMLSHFGVESQMIGCSALTLPKWQGDRSGEVVVMGAGHSIAPDMSWSDQFKYANERLASYQSAERVVTDKLHVALPCIAFGTPVVIVKPDLPHMERFSILRYLGWPGFSKEPILIDAEPIAARYRDFINSALSK